MRNRWIYRQTECSTHFAGWTEKKLEYRGYDSAGIAVEHGGAISLSKVSGRIANLCEKTEDGKNLPGFSGIGHTRWATHGAPTDANAHPHMSCDGRFSVVHNGIIENYMELREELSAKGYTFNSQTDTEVIVHLLEMYYDGDLKAAVMRTTSRLEGSYALGALCSECPGKIMEQPRMVKAALAPRVHNKYIQLDDFGFTADELRSIRKIVITACSSAYYAGCAGKYAIEKLCHIPVDVQLASELRYSEPQIDDKTLLIVLSQSGETADTIAAMKECQSLGARTLAIVNVVGSTISKLADHTLYTWAGPEIAVATTKGYTTQLTVLYLFAVYAARTMELLSEQEHTRLITELQAIPKKIQQALDMNAALPQLAGKYNVGQSVFYIGRNTDYAVALEGALKMKEISCIHAEAYAAGELKHGTIALIDEGQPVIALCCNSHIAEKTMNNIVEVKARGAQVLALALKGNRAILAQADDVIYIPALDPLFQPLVEIIPLQLLAYYVAKENGCDIDKPKNLAKSVTVE